MGHGPVDVIMVGFPGSRFNGTIIPELDRLVDAGTIAVIDGLVVRKGPDGAVDFLELADAEGDVAALSRSLGEGAGLLSEDDVIELADALEPDSTGAILIFEHLWARQLKDAVTASGGSLVSDLRVPGDVVDALVAELDALN